MYGLSEKNIEQIRSILRQYPQIREVVLYGSRAREREKAGSDIDLDLKGTGPDLRLLSRVDTERDDLMFPYHFDLLLYDSFKNPDLLREIDTTGVIFYQA